MVEGEMSEVSESEMIEAIEAAHVAIKAHCKMQEELAAEVGDKSKKKSYSHETHDDALKARIIEATYDKYYKIAKQGLAKADRKEAFGAVRTELNATFSEEELSENAWMIDQYVKSSQKKAIRDLVLNDGQRLDNRKTTEIRPISGEVDYLPMTHGSAIFTRGETQSLTTLTLGSKLDQQKSTVQWLSVLSVSCFTIISLHSLLARLGHCVVLVVVRLDTVIWRFVRSSRFFLRLRSVLIQSD
jgi:polyribonucleotide nucleotidyltransferase